MPLIRIQTNIDVDAEKKLVLMNELSLAGAELLEKPESYMMVILDDGLEMQLSGTVDPCAFLEVRSVGEISDEQVTNLSGKLSELVGNIIGVGAGRIYINFTYVPGNRWAFDGRTFC